MSTASQPAPKKGLFGRKKKPKDPSKPGWFKQLRQVVSMTRKADPASMWWVLLAALVVLVIGLLIGLALDMVIYVMVLSVPLALLAAVIVLGRRAERAAFSQIEGKPGAAAAVLQQLKRGWFYDQEPVAAEAGGQVRGMRDLHNAAMVFRAVGKPGIVLIAEGPAGAAKRLTVSETRKVTRVVGEEVPVHSIVVGRGEGQVPLAKVVRTIKKLPRQISNDEAVAVQQRLKALVGRNRPPVPAGMDPMRPPRASRRALRGK